MNARALFRHALWSSLLVSGCGSESADGTSCPTTAALFGATAHDRFLLLSPVEEQAVVAIQKTASPSHPSPPCSGVLVSPTWVLGAAHCFVGEIAGAEVRFGPFQEQPELAVSAARWEVHPMLDAILVELASEVPASVAVPIAPGDLAPDELVGARVLLAGYGTTEDNFIGLRRFVTEPVVMADGGDLITDGSGESGACSGDSGGPLLWWSGSHPVVVGILRGGDPNCRGKDTYTGVASLLDWIDEVAPAPPRPSQVLCGRLDAQGRCFESAGIRESAWCAEENRAGARCGDSQVCGWDETAGGFRCMAAAQDACMGVPRLGICQGGGALRCEGGHVVRETCGPCATCGIEPVTGAAGCRSPAPFESTPSL